MSRPQSCIEGEAPDSQHAKSNRGSKVTKERAALLVSGVLLAAALIVIYRLLFEIVRTKENLKNLEDHRMKCENNLTDEPCDRCEAGWEHHGGKCYHFSISKSSWNQSRAECRAEGGDLVKIDSRWEQRFLDGRVRDLMNEDEDKFWIGLTDSAAEGRWMWVDNTPLTESLKFWSGKEPNNWRGKRGEHADGEDCARMGERGGAEEIKCWFDAVCSKAHRSICEKAEGWDLLQFLPAGLLTCSPSANSLGFQ
ncbi:hepatic lectin-like [Archocentrus centrarchus]|uniref:hepatic lectin-like n=1 Tax=Archocentrus centrarchus TaxID=63155 RepID=UPI0011E9E5B4|nr:hepatic lectin-like [Archocentrus centrarchus]